MQVEGDDHIITKEIGNTVDTHESWQRTSKSIHRRKPMLDESNRKIIFVLAPHALRHPKDDGRKHQGCVLGNGCVAIVGELFLVCMSDVFQHQKCLTYPAVGKNIMIDYRGWTYDTSSKTTSHQGETNEQE